MDWITAVREIQRAQENDRLIIFVGAGVSKNSGIPSWWGLIKKFAEEVGYSRCDTCKKRGSECPTEECVDQYEYTQEEYLRIPEYYYQQDTSENHTNYYQLIQNTLHSDEGSNLIDDEIFSIFPRHIITTNFDPLLEKSKAVNSSLYSVVTEDSDLLSKASDRYIIKMHGDLDKPKTIVLKESDYINYEQEHPLISTFIKSLLVNHTFVFLGYSLNDNNLNLIIGWINYFRELHGVKKRPANLLITSKQAIPFEQIRLETRNIHLVSLDSMPADLVKKVSASWDINDDAGCQLLAFLRCITDPGTAQQYVSIDERLCERYQLLLSYRKISYQDIIAMYPLGRTQFLSTELVFYDREWYERIQKMLSDKDSIVSEVFRKAGITAISLYTGEMHFSVMGFDTTEDILENLYFDNNYVALGDELEGCKDLLQKMYYSRLVGKEAAYVKMLVNAAAEISPPTDYISVLLHKSRERIATLSHFDRQEEITLELQRAFNVFPPERYKHAVTFLRMLYESPAKSIQRMADILHEHQVRYAYNSQTIYFDQPYKYIWELKAYAYDYYFFFKENCIPLNYFLEPKEYLRYYLEAILCSYTPQKENGDVAGLGLHNNNQCYKLNDIDLDMLVKYVSVKNLRAWIKKYSVHKLEFTEKLDISRKFINLWVSFMRLRVKHWIEQLHCFSLLLCLVDIEESDKSGIANTLAEVIKDLAASSPFLIVDIFDAIEVIMNSIMDDNGKTVILDALLLETIQPVLFERKDAAYRRMLKKYARLVSEETKKRIWMQVDEVDDVKQKLSKLECYRRFYPKDMWTSFFQERFELLSARQVFDLVVEGIIPYDERCWNKLIETLKKEAEARNAKPIRRTLPDWLRITVEECIILKLVGCNIDITLLEPYACYSEYLLFMLNPQSFDYSCVDIEDYMWQNLIYSDEYQSFFIEHRAEILSEELKTAINSGLASEDQRKIVYGLLLKNEELRSY